MIAVTIPQRFGKLKIKNCNPQSGQKLAACFAAFERLGIDSTRPRLPSIRLSPGAIHVRVCAHFADLKLESTSNASNALPPAYDAKINLSQPSTTLGPPTTFRQARRHACHCIAGGEYTLKENEKFRKAKYKIQASHVLHGNERKRNTRTTRMSNITVTGLKMSKDVQKYTAHCRIARQGSAPHSSIPK